MLKATTERDVREKVQLTPHQIRASVRVHAVPACASGASGDELLDAICRRFALEPDVRWSMVEEARDRLRASGPPTAQVLADMLVAEFHPMAVG